MNKENLDCNFSKADLKLVLKKRLLEMKRQRQFGLSASQFDPEFERKKRDLDARSADIERKIQPKYALRLIC
jgi:hypothetical protein